MEIIYFMKVEEETKYITHKTINSGQIGILTAVAKGSILKNMH